MAFDTLQVKAVEGFATLQVKAVEGLLSFKKTKMTYFPLSESTLIIDRDSYVTAYQQQTK